MLIKSLAKKPRRVDWFDSPSTAPLMAAIETTCHLKNAA
jgi:hypothetical protein